MSPQKAIDPGMRDFIRLAEASPAMIWIADAAGRCTYANAAWLEFRGRTLEQELGAGWAEGIHPEDREQTQRKVELAIRVRSRIQIAFRVKTANGGYQVIEDVGLPLCDERGNVRGYLGGAAVLNGHSVKPDAGQLALLTARERQVLELVALGLGTKQVAERLGIGYKTADSHRTHVLKKLGLHETASLVRFAVRAGVIAA